MVTQHASELERIRAFVASHGYGTWIEGEAVHFVSHYSKRNPDGSTSWGSDVVQVATPKAARLALGY